MAPRWFRTWVPRPRAARRLLCFPWAGGGALAFRPWAASFPETVEVCAVEYPGRGTREAELPLDDVAALAEAVGPEAQALLDRPIAVLGYSLGALVAFEWLRKRPSPGMPPVHFVACARRAPHLPARFPPLHGLPDDTLVAEVRRRFDAIPDLLLGEPELLARFLVALRADLRAVERYRYRDLGTGLPCGVTAVGGDSDPDVTLAELQAWAVHAGGAFQARQLPTGHFFLGDPRLRRHVIDLVDFQAERGEGI